MLVAKAESPERHPAGELAFLAGDDSLVFRRAIGFLSALTAAYVLARMAVGSDLSRTLAPIIILVSGPLAWWVNRRRHARASFVFYFWMLWLAILIQAMVRAGVANSSLHALPVLMLIGGWALGLRQGLLLGAASVVVTGIMAWAQHAGVWTALPQSGA